MRGLDPEGGRSAECAGREELARRIAARHTMASVADTIHEIKQEIEHLRERLAPLASGKQRVQAHSEEHPKGKDVTNEHAQHLRDTIARYERILMALTTGMPR